MVGKGATSRHWKDISHEAEIYHVLQPVQRFAVPVFLETFDMALIYLFEDGAEIRHMLFMSWGRECMRRVKREKTIKHELSQSKSTILSYRIIHQDLRLDRQHSVGIRN